MRVIKQGPTRRNVFKDVARLRRQDAAALFQENQADRRLGAVYLLGYSIECHLKYAVCEQHEWDRLPETVQIPGHQTETKLYVHDWSVLVEAAGLRPTLRNQRAVNAIYSALSDQWGPNLRYRTKRFTDAQGRDLYNDLAQLYQFFRETIP